MFVQIPTMTVVLDQMESGRIGMIVNGREDGSYETYEDAVEAVNEFLDDQDEPVGIEDRIAERAMRVQNCGHQIGPVLVRRPTVVES